jgi:hypothetical protein
MGEVIQFRKRRPVEEIDMRPVLGLARSAIIGWVALSLLPFALAFDAIEDELKWRGQKL